MLSNGIVSVGGLFVKIGAANINETKQLDLISLQFKSASGYKTVY